MKNIIENNKLIAEFLVNNEGNLVKIRDGVYSTIDENEVPDDDLTINDLKYHEDWNWLMEVVEKIESLGNDILITSNYIQITYDKGEKFITIELEGNIKIFAVYNACIEFIKWYNEQNKNNEKHTCIIDK